MRSISLSTSSAINIKGFTLVELSIVLLIIGLIIGGITAGSSLIKQASLRSVISEQRSFSVAINNFLIAYGSLPGDIKNASSFWPSCDATPANCNGNGDGTIYFNFTASTNESYRAWQHLSLAGIIQGSYTGVGGPPSYQCYPSTVVPLSKFGSNNGYFFDNAGTYNVVITLGGVASGIECNSSSISPADAYNIDTKIDDGIPNTGVIQVYGGLNSGGSPWDSNCSSGSNYLNLNSNIIHCKLQYIYK
jgi:prepilin-type N-terminal cleavage/methylation domain-containing protein